MAPAWGNLFVMRWYIPSWNGDIRAEQAPDWEDRTRITIIEPTPNELMTLGRLEHQFREHGWYDGEGPLWTPVKDRRRREAKRQEVFIGASLAQVVPLLVEGYTPGEQTLTAVVYRDGEVETVDGTQGGEALVEVAEKAVAKKAKKATSVKRATPCCPACVPGSVEPASEVLLDFLDARQHADWSRHRYIQVRGGRTGHRYVLAHRNSELAVRMGRICWDADDRTVLHFHDSSVPPEEEVLGAMLVLRHREHWLRNEATVIQPSFHRDGTPDHLHRPASLLDNPFGDYLDGVEDAGITQTIGGVIAGLAHGMGIEGDYDWWLSEMWASFEQLANQLVAEGDGFATEDDGLLNDDEREFMEVARRLGAASPEALGHVALYYRRRADGIVGPELQGVLE